MSKPQTDDLEDLFGFVSSTPSDQITSSGVGSGASAAASSARAAEAAGPLDDLMELHHSSGDDLLAQFDALSTGGAQTPAFGASGSKPLPPLPNASAAAPPPAQSAAVPSSKSATGVDSLLDIFESAPQPPPKSSMTPPPAPQVPPKRPAGLPPGAANRFSGISGSGSTPDFSKIGDQRTDISPSAAPTLSSRATRSPSPAVLSASNSSNQFDPFASLMDGIH